jgi:hypothetical protein
VPPQGYLEVESRNSPTRPRALRALARSAVRAGLSWDPANHLPVQRFVRAQERARLIFHARRELPRVTAVASQVMLVDSRLVQAEEALRQAVAHRAAMSLGPPRTLEPPGVVARPSTTVDDLAPRQPPGIGRSRPPLIGPWSEAAVLAGVAGGQGVLAYMAAIGGRFGTVPVGLLAVAAAVGSTAAAQLAARGINRLATTPDGADDPRRRRQLDTAVAGGALVCGVTLAAGVGHLSAEGGAAATRLALLGLATAAAYAATPGGSGTPEISRWRWMTTRLRRLRSDHRHRRDLRAARSREAAARAAPRQLREELAVLVPQLFAAEQAALLFWRYQVAIGDAAQHSFEQHLAAYSLRRSRGVRRPIVDWWRGATPTPPRTGEEPASIGGDQPDWGNQVARVTMAAKRVLVRRGLLDITHGLRLPPMPGAGLIDEISGAAQSQLAPLLRDGRRQPIEPPDPDRAAHNLTGFSDGNGGGR